MATFISLDYPHMHSLSPLFCTHTWN